MVVANGITIKVRGADGTPFPESGQHEEDMRSFRYRMIHATPGDPFELSVTIEERFHWMGSDTLFLAVAYDDGNEGHLQSSDLTQAWAIRTKEGHLGQYTFKNTFAWERNDLSEQAYPYLMPDIVAASTRRIAFDPYRHRSKEKLVSHRGCISIYIHRGHISSLNTAKKRPADPPASVLDNDLTAIEPETLTQINFDCFEPLQPLTGNVCELHFRNVSLADFAKVMAAVPPKSKLRKAASATPASDRSATLDATVARTSQGLRGLPKQDYSVKKVYDKMNFSWNQGDQDTEEQQELDTGGEDIFRARRRCTKRKVIRRLEESDEDDEETIVATPRKATKQEYPAVQAAPLETVEDHEPVVAGADVVRNGNDADANVRKRRKLEMEMQGIDLARRKNALEMAAVELDQRAHRVKYELAKMG